MKASATGDYTTALSELGKYPSFLQKDDSQNLNSSTSSFNNNKANKKRTKAKFDKKLNGNNNSAKKKTKSNISNSSWWHNESQFDFGSDFGNKAVKQFQKGNIGKGLALEALGTVEAISNAMGVYMGAKVVGAVSTGIGAAINNPKVQEGLKKVSQGISKYVDKTKKSLEKAKEYISENYFRIDKIGRWKKGGQWKSGKHLHLDPIPGSKSLMRHHLPSQLKQWGHHLKGIIRKKVKDIFK